MAELKLGTTVGGFAAWHEGNDGSGSGLDADTLDGNHASAFATAAHIHNYAGSASSGGPATAAESSPLLSVDTSMLFGRGGLQYLNISGAAGDVATSTNAPTADWWHIIRGNHANAAGYYTDLALPMTSAGNIRYRRISAGASSGWITMLDSTNYNSYTPTLTGTGASGTWAISVSGNAATATAATSASTATTAANLSGFTNTNSAAPIVGADALTNNGIGYVSSMSLLGQTDGALYGQAHSTSWVHQIYGDYRTGQIALRGKNNGAWQAWRTVWDSGNLTNLNQLANGPGYITTSASITGSAATLTTARTLTIGSTGKAFNGSANVEWTLTEIGAAAATHTHSYLSAESDTLDTVTQRGSTTTSAISITNTTPSSGTSVGALVVSGGIACAGTIRAQALTSATTVVATNFVTAGELYADSTAYIGGLVSPFSSDGGYATGTVELDSFSSGLYTGAKYIVEITRDFDRKKRISEFLLVVEDYPQGPNLKFTEYGILNTGTDNLGYCRAVMFGELVKVQFVRTGTWSLEDCTWKVIKLGKMLTM